MWSKKKMTSFFWIDCYPKNYHVKMLVLDARGLSEQPFPDHQFVHGFFDHGRAR